VDVDAYPGVAVKGPFFASQAAIPGLHEKTNKVLEFAGAESR
jgi:hypothetical protein